MATVDAEEVRQACSRAILKLATGQQARAVEILEELGGRCFDLVTAEQMEQGRAAGAEDRYDLAALNRDTVNLHDDQPEREG